MLTLYNFILNAKNNLFDFILSDVVGLESPTYFYELFFVMPSPNMLKSNLTGSWGHIFLRF